jgi:hypothetical protein
VVPPGNAVSRTVEVRCGGIPRDATRDRAPRRRRASYSPTRALHTLERPDRPQPSSGQLTVPLRSKPRSSSAKPAPAAIRAASDHARSSSWGSMTAATAGPAPDSHAWTPRERSAVMTSPLGRHHRQPRRLVQAGRPRAAASTGHTPASAASTWPARAAWRPPGVARGGRAARRGPRTVCRTLRRDQHERAQARRRVDPPDDEPAVVARRRTRPARRAAPARRCPGAPRARGERDEVAVADPGRRSPPVRARARPRSPTTTTRAHVRAGSRSTRSATSGTATP